MHMHWCTLTLNQGGLIVESGRKSKYASVILTGCLPGVKIDLAGLVWFEDPFTTAGKPHGWWNQLFKPRTSTRQTWDMEMALYDCKADRHLRSTRTGRHWWSVMPLGISQLLEVWVKTKEHWKFRSCRCLKIRRLMEQMEPWRAKPSLTFAGSSARYLWCCLMTPYGSHTLWDGYRTRFLERRPRYYVLGTIQNAKTHVVIRAMPNPIWSSEAGLSPDI